MNPEPELETEPVVLDLVEDDEDLVAIAISMARGNVIRGEISRTAAERMVEDLSEDDVPVLELGIGGGRVRYIRTAHIAMLSVAWGDEYDDAEDEGEGEGE